MRRGSEESHRVFFFFLRQCNEHFVEDVRYCGFGFATKIDPSLDPIVPRFTLSAVGSKCRGSMFALLRQMVMALDGFQVCSRP